MSIWQSSTRKPSLEPNLIPLINVVFLLLIFFMVSSTFLQPDNIPVTTPKSQSGIVRHDDAVQILVTRTGDMYIADEYIEPKHLNSVMQHLLAKAPDRPVTLKADAGLEAHKLLHLMERLSLAGVDNLALATENPAP